MEPSGQARLAAAGVTAREAEVLAVIGGRLSNQEIAERLGISVRTVESHVSALLRKLVLPGRPALVQLARQLDAGPALPVPPTSFVGRAEELAQLRGLLAAGPLVCLTGPAGCGKSRLALEAARRWPGESRIAALASVAATDVGAVIATALGLGYDSADLAALTWAAEHDTALADRLMRCLAQLIEMLPSRRGIEVISATASSQHAGWSSEALAWASCVTTYLNLGTAGELAARSARQAAGDLDRAYALWAAGWVHAYGRREAAALGCLDQVIAYAQAAGEPWLEASAWQARGLARNQNADAFGDWQQAAVRFAAAGDLMHASNVRYMLAQRAVEAGERLTEVPVWLDECESFAASHGYRHELAHIHLVRAAYERRRGRLDGARELLGDALTVFRQAGDFRCVTRTLLELAGHHRPGQPAAAADLLLQGLGMATLAGGESLCARVLAGLITAAAEAGDLPLAARALGALDALDQSQVWGGTADARPAVPADLASALHSPACAAYVDEGRAGGISLIITLYPRLPVSSLSSSTGTGQKHFGKGS